MSDRARNFRTISRENRPQSESHSLSDMLDIVENTFGIEKILTDRGEDRVSIYYKQSRMGYEKFYSDQGCMHLALNRDGVFDPAGYEAQAEHVSKIITQSGAGRVLELGAGLAFNSRLLAARHKDVDFLALDLMKDHVVRSKKHTRAHPNLSVHQGSFEPLSRALRKFDVIFAVESLCYARSPEQVAKSIAECLNPGGHLIIFDAHRKPQFSEFPADLRLASELYEVSMAITNGFARATDWSEAIQAAGLVVIAVQDETDAIGPGILRLHTMSVKFLTTRKYQLAAKMMPRYMVQNAVAGLLGPYVYFGDPFGADNISGTAAYHLVTAQKPMNGS